MDDETRRTPSPDEATRLTPRDEDADATRLSGPGRTSARSAPQSGSGWLTSSGSIDHGRFAPGEVVDGRYRIIGLVGRGGMGEVFRADDLRLGQPVALKFLPAALGQDPVRLAQFHNEVRTARQVSHPNVCRVYDIGEADGQLYLTMEYVDGEDLASLLRRIGRLPEDKALDLARQICAGLAAAHERGVLHRDLKPANIMVDADGRARVMDFSLASVGAVADVRAGTPAYMAPEQLQGREVTVRSDLFALGLVLHELFTGRRVFTATSIGELVRQHESGSTTSVSDVVRGIDPSVERTIARCLEPEPARRPASARAVAASLGADALAAALAAGETPTPEMVAAAGGQSAAFGAATGVALLAAIAVLLVVGAAMSDRVILPARVPLPKPPVVLADRAYEIGRTFGYTGPVAGTAGRFTYDGDFLNWTARRIGADANRTLTTGRPPAILYWYRTSPRPLDTLDPFGGVDPGDPPMTVAGMTAVVLDPEGRLVRFRAVPRQMIEQPAPPAPPVDWSTAFALADLPMAAFHEVAPQRTPADYADERRAWDGTVAELPGETLHVEAAAYAGRVTMFDTIAPWSRPTRDVAFEGAGTGQITGTVGSLIVVLLPVGAALLARRNLKAKRGDRRGALALATTAFFLSMGAWVAGPAHGANLPAEVDRFFVALGMSLFQGGLLYAVYLAVEPLVRRVWPNVLITWARVTRGVTRDPMVGRDLVIGTLLGLAVTIVSLLYNVLPPLIGMPEPVPALPALTTMLGTRFVAVAMLERALWALQNALIAVLVLALLRALIRRDLGAIRRDWIVAAVVTAVFTVVSSRSAPTDGYLWFTLAYTALLSLLFIVALMRFGLVASIVMFFVSPITASLPITLDVSKLYAGPALGILAVVALLAGLGFWMARAGEPLFGRAAPELAGAGAP